MGVVTGFHGSRDGNAGEGGGSGGGRSRQSGGRSLACRLGGCCSTGVRASAALLRSGCPAAKECPGDPDPRHLSAGKKPIRSLCTLRM